MPTLPRSRLVTDALTAALAAALAASLVACTGDDPPKLVSVDNQTPNPGRVEIGATDFGVVAPGTVTGYLEVGDGEQAVLLDGRVVLTTTLGSDNVGGSWTLYLQWLDLPGGGGQTLVGVTADD